MKKYVIVIVLLVLMGAIYGLNYGKQDVAIPQDKLQVTTSFYPLYFFASVIGGDKAEVKNITPLGAEPHEYEPTPQDLVAIHDSDLLVLLGAGFEPWSKDVLKNLGEGKTIINAGEKFANLKGEEHGHEEKHKEEEEYHGVTDPHVWLSPKLAQKVVDEITLGFVEVSPKNKDYYLANANTLKDKLQKLDLEYQSGLKVCKHKNIITSHVAFAYLAKDYGLTQVAITGISPEDEPSLKELAEIALFARSNNVKYIFFESLVSSKLAQTLASEVGVQTLVLNPLESLTPGEVKEGKDYFTEMKSNLANLQTALECSNRWQDK